MPPPDHSKTFGLSDLKVATLTGETPGTLVDVPGIRSCEVTITTDSEELRGDGKVIAIVDKGQGATFSIEEGGFSMSVAEIIFGATAVESGTGTAEVSRLDLKSGAARPYFFLTGQALDDAGGDVQVVLWKAKATGDVTLNFADENFLTPGIDGQAVGRSSDDLLCSIIQHETAAALAVPAP
jgi:hypothetical protein